MSKEDVILNSKEGIYKEYDPQFTADISKRMQLPDRLVAVNGYCDDPNVSFNNHITMRDAHRMNLPLNQIPFEEPRYILATPPDTITNFSGTTLVDEDDMNPEIERFRRSLYNSPEHRTFRGRGDEGTHEGNDEEDEYEDCSVPMTPGTMLLMQNGDGMAALQRQIGKLNYRVVRLQEENRRRKNMEIVFYPLVIGYLIIQLGRFLVNAK